MEQKPVLSANKSLQALDWLNLFLADVRDGVGPYLAIYLLATHKWDPAQIGLAMSVSGIATVIAQTPAGALVDRLRQKRMLVAIASVLVAIGCIAMVTLTTLPVVVAGQALIGAAAAVFPPAIAAITLGMVGHPNLSKRIGRNEALNHAGNVIAAALAGLIGHYIAREGIFYLVAVMCVGSIISVLTIREEDIDHELARSAAEDKEHQPHISSFKELIFDSRVLIFAVAAILFHFANAAMLPLVGQLLSNGKATGASLYMSACIIVAQLVMIPMSVWAGKLASSWGRKPIFLLGFAVLPIRGILYTLSDNPYFLVSVQILDGIGAGIFGVLAVIVVADITKGTGRFNLTQGAISTAQSVGASLSNLMTGFVVAKAGYDVGFMVLAAIAAVAVGFFWLLMPETKGSRPHYAE